MIKRLSWYNLFARHLDTTTVDIERKCGDLIDFCNFNYEILLGNERDKILKEVFEIIENDTQKIGVKKRTKVWDDGWKENLIAFGKKADPNTLIPKFIKKKGIIRLSQNFIQPESPTFELDFYRVIRQWIYKTYINDCMNVYEFGCGSGHNLWALSELYADVDLHGLDFVKSAVDLANLIGKFRDNNISGQLFDMKNPDIYFNLEDYSIVFTVGTIEQLAGKYEPFMEYLFKQNIKRVVHVEPLIELYDESNFIDYTAIQFHKKRGYTEGFLPYLIQKEKLGKIKITKIRRLYFGSMMMEGYMLIVWEKIK
tara:strand:+ start:2085 stop:3017 length:933 start_codon:yes stop_codon:yes gene_type:complete